jgi:hypothetical protein
LPGYAYLKRFEQVADALEFFEKSSRVFVAPGPIRVYRH